MRFVCILGITFKLFGETDIMVLELGLKDHEYEYEFTAAANAETGDDA